MLWMIHTILGHELKDLNVMNNSGLWMKWPILGHELRVVDTMNNLGLWMNKRIRVMSLRPQMLWTPHYYGSYERLWILWPSASKYYEKLRAKNDMNDSLLWSYSFKCYEKLRAGMTWRTPGRELRALYAMNSLELWLTRTSLSHELEALYAMNNSRFWVMSYSRLSAYSFLCYEELRVLEDMMNQDPISSRIYMLWTT